MKKLLVLDLDETLLHARELPLAHAADFHVGAYHVYKHVRNYGNLVTVREFTGDRPDTELPDLARYLRTLLPHPNVRTIEKRHWRDELRDADGL